MIYDSRNYKAIWFLDPVVQDKVKQLLGRLEAIGEDILIVSGKRTSGEQDKLYAQVPRVTHVNNSNSYHTWGMAVDFVPVTYFGLQWKNGIRFRTIAREAMILGFDWGYQMWGFDLGHLQYTEGLSIGDLKRGKRLKLSVADGVGDVQTPSRGSRASLRINSLRRGMRRSTGRIRLMLERQLVRLMRRIS